MNMITIVRTSLIAVALTGALGVAPARAQTDRSRRSSTVPDLPPTVTIPDLTDLSDRIRDQVSAALANLPDFGDPSALAFQDPGKKPLPKVKTFADRSD